MGLDWLKESYVRWESTGAKRRCHGNQFLAFYNFVCMIASDTLFDSSGGFLGSSYLMENIAEIKCIRVVAMATNCGTKTAITGFV